MEKPDVSWRYVDHGSELALYWINPWSKSEEKIATFWWPSHPPEETERVEMWFEEYARQFVEQANDCAFDCHLEGGHPGCKKHSGQSATRAERE